MGIRTRKEKLTAVRLLPFLFFAFFPLSVSGNVIKLKENEPVRLESETDANARIAVLYSNYDQQMRAGYITLKSLENPSSKYCLSSLNIALDGVAFVSTKYLGCIALTSGYDGQGLQIELPKLSTKVTVEAKFSNGILVSGLFTLAKSENVESNYDAFKQKMHGVVVRRKSILKDDVVIRRSASDKPKYVEIAPENNRVTLRIGQITSKYLSLTAACSPPGIEKVYSLVIKGKTSFTADYDNWVELAYLNPPFNSQFTTFLSMEMLREKAMMSPEKIAIIRADCLTKNKVTEGKPQIVIVPPSERVYYDPV